MKKPTPIDIERRPPRRSATRKTAAPRPDRPPRKLPVFSEADFRRFAESSDDVFWLASPARGALLYVSPRFEALWGIPAEAVMRDPAQWNAAVLPDDAQQLPAPFFAGDQVAEDSVREYRIQSHTGQVRWIRDRRFVLHNSAANDAVSLVGGIAEDVTERKQRELDSAQLLRREREARAAAEAAALAKDEFLAIVTHELRSPLNAIRGWSHVLRHGGPLEGVQLKALDAIDRNTQAQARLVDDLLDSQRILCGKLQLEMAQVSLSAVIDEALEAVRPSAQAKRLRLEVAHDPSVGIVKIDPDRLRQALVKLLSNAVKFTPEDGIVSVSTRRGGKELSITVQDTGAGIEPSQLQLMFGPFQQADSSNTRRANGLGLGLSLARQLIELHGGGIGVASEGAGRGTRFTVRLPLSVLNENDALQDPESSSPLAGKKIVIVEDDEDGREVLGLILRGAQVELQSFENAAAAYEYLAHASADQQPDALISDIAMPGEDGYAFIRRVREMEGSRHRRRVAALALTSFARVEDRIRALKAGFDAHMAKPIDPERVLSTLARALDVHERATAAGS